MSFVGKILVVFQMFAALVFMCFAAAVYTTHTKWKTAFEKQEAATKQAKQEVAQAQGDFEKLKRDTTTEIGTLKTNLDNATNRATTAEQEVQAAKTRESQLQVEMDKAQQQAKIGGEEAEARKQETDILREQNKTFLEGRTQLANELSKANDQIKSLEFNLDAAVVKNNLLIKQNALLSQTLTQHKISVEAIEEGTSPPPPLDGFVLETTPAKGTGSSELVTISLGADDRLRKGHKLSVYRSSKAAGGTPKYLGKIEIVRTLPDRAVGIVVERAGQGTLQKGDNVTSKL